MTTIEAARPAPGRSHGPEDIDYPVWVPVLCAAVVAAAMTDAVIRRGALVPPRWPALVALVAISPWLVDAVMVLLAGKHTPTTVGFPKWLFSLVVLCGIAALVWYPPESDVAPFALVILTAEMACRMRFRAGIAVALGAMAVMLGADLFGNYDDSFIWLVGIAAAWFGGAALQYQLLLAVETRSAQEHLVERAAAEERQRIAREVHDVIAHSLSVTMLHITAARMALEKEQRAEALESLREAETQGRNSLAEIRRTVGLLGPDELATAPPMPVAADLPKLVADFRAAGLEVELTMNGDVSALPPAAGLNLYRIVQESLTNVVKHAPGASASVELIVTDDIRLRVRNTTVCITGPPANGAGLGMRGMSERASLLGGRVDVLVGEGGWTVSLVAPRPSA